jgi:ADP-heptose:LPS heptosyltransferase
MNGVAVPDFEDFADVAALASLMDEVVSIDTAALHVAGAIGHHDVTALLPFAPCWRWHCGSPWYPQIKLCRQKIPGDVSARAAGRSHTAHRHDPFRVDQIIRQLEAAHS